MDLRAMLNREERLEQLFLDYDGSKFVDGQQAVCLLAIAMELNHINRNLKKLRKNLRKVKMDIEVYDE